MNKYYTDIDVRLNELAKELQERIKVLAIQVLTQNTCLSKFSMCMGSATFQYQGMEEDEHHPGSFFNIDEDFEPYDLFLIKDIKERAAVMEINFVLEKYEELLLLTTHNLNIIKEDNVLIITSNQELAQETD
jgi:hypothetical protein